MNKSGTKSGTEHGTKSGGKSGMKLKSVKTVMYGHTWKKAHQSTKDQVSTSISPDIFRALGVPPGHRATLQIQRLIERQTHTNLNIFS